MLDNACMGVLTTPDLLTVEEFAKLPDPAGARLELRHGEPVAVTFPAREHREILFQTFRLLDRCHPDKMVRPELAFRPSIDHELWAADIGVFTREQDRASSQSKWLVGAPEIVVEVVSPSNTPDELEDRERTCFAGGAREFWVIYLTSRHVKVSRADGTTARYGAGEAIPTGKGTIAVNDIFEILD